MTIEIALYILIGLRKHYLKPILDMFLLFQVHHMENEDQDLLYPVSDGSYEKIEYLSRISVPLIT